MEKSSIRKCEGVSGTTIRDGLERLQGRAFGGEDVAAKPEKPDDKWWPRAALLPGVQVAIDRFSTIPSPEVAMEVVFLMGGAGNGKSFAARELGERLGLRSENPGALAQRTYTATVDGAKYYLLNDATIAPRREYKNQEVALAADLFDWFEQSSQMLVRGFCCVNRGIVADEIRGLQEVQGPEPPLSFSILRWLANPEDLRFDQIGATELTARQHDAQSATRELEFVLAGRRVRLVALAVDSYSLFELDSSVGFSRGQTLFAELLARFDGVDGERPDLCPIRSNIIQWQSQTGQGSWQQLMSSAEIASGRLYSYRDVWGAAAMSLLGPRVNLGSKSQEILEYLDSLIEVATNCPDARGRLAAVISLSKHRAHCAIFRSPVPQMELDGTEFPPATPIHAGLALVDPAVWRSADSKSVEAAMQCIAMGELPSRELLKIPDVANVWSKFDEYLERTLLEYVDSPKCSDIERRRLISWYGAYVARLVGVARGAYGNVDVIEQWRRCHRSCNSGSARLPIELEQSISALIFPPHPEGPASSMLLPAFSARAEPVSSVKEQVQPKLVEIVSVASVSLQVRRQGSRLVIQCYIAGNPAPIGQLVLDFALIREAQAFNQGLCGQTESTTYIEPRIERCRSSSMAAIDRTQRRLAVVANGTYKEVAR